MKTTKEHPLEADVFSNEECEESSAFERDKTDPEIDLSQIDLSQLEASQSIRQITMALAESEQIQEFPEVSDAAVRINEASDADLPKLLQELLAALQQLAEQPDSTTAQEAAGAHRMLIVEDDVQIAALLRARFEETGQPVEIVEDPKEAEQRIAQKTISLVILDYIMPDSEGRNLLIRLRDRSTTTIAPVIFTNTQEAQQHPELADAIPRTHTPSSNDLDTVLYQNQTPPPITNTGLVYQRSASDALPMITLQEQALVRAPQGPWNEMPLRPRAPVQVQYNELFAYKDKSLQDPVTGLPNQLAVDGIYKRLIQHAAKEKDPFTVAVLAFDHFNAFRSMYGKTVAEETQRRATHMIVQSLRQSDLLCQWEDDLFLVFFVSTRLDRAYDALRRTLEGLRVMPIAAPDNQLYDLTFSAGLVEVQQEKALEPMLDEAKRFLALAQAQGQGQLFSSLQEKPAATKRVLLADDDELATSLLRHRFEREGFEVIHCTEGTKALDIALSQKLSLVLCDAALPKMDGFELLRRIRRVPALQRVPVVMLTSKNSEKDIVRGFELGADDYLIKPFSPVELLARVQRLLKRT